MVVAQVVASRTTVLKDPSLILCCELSSHLPLLLCIFSYISGVSFIRSRNEVQLYSSKKLPGSSAEAKQSQYAQNGFKKQYHLALSLAHLDCQSCIKSSKITPPFEFVVTNSISVSNNIFSKFQFWVGFCKSRPNHPSPIFPAACSQVLELNFDITIIPDHKNRREKKNLVLSSSRINKFEIV